MANDPTTVGNEIRKLAELKPEIREAFAQAADSMPHTSSGMGTAQKRVLENLKEGVEDEKKYAADRAAQRAAAQRGDTDSVSKMEKQALLDKQNAEEHFMHAANTVLRAAVAEKNTPGYDTAMIDKLTTITDGKLSKEDLKKLVTDAADATPKLIAWEGSITSGYFLNKHTYDASFIKLDEAIGRSVEAHLNEIAPGAAPGQAKAPNKVNGR